jgi:hypothetical protein
VRTTWPAVIAALLLIGSAAAHQELLFARITTDPPVPAPGEPFDLQVLLSDSSGRQLAGASLAARIGEAGSGGSGRSTEGGAAPAGAVPLRAEPGRDVYRATVEPLPAGDHDLTLMELAGGGVESAARGRISVGAAQVDLELVLPASNSRGLGSWLLWLVGLPLLAGVLIVLLLLTGGEREGAS